MKNKMLRPVRIRARLGNPPKPFFTNRVECGNSMISSETGHTESAVDKFVAHVQGLSERQARNVRWAIVNKGPYRLHPSLQHFEMAEEDWLLMSRGEKDSYIKMVLNSNVALTSELKETENHTDAIQVDESDHCLSMSGLSVLAEAALSELIHGKESSEPTDETKQTPMINLDEFRKYFNTQPDGTVEGIYKKAVELLGKENGIVRAPGCGEKARMVESRRLKERPHLVTPGKKKGEYRCEKNCRHYNGIRICSHTVATAQQNGELLDFLALYQRSSLKRGTTFLTQQQLTCLKILVEREASLRRLKDLTPSYLSMNA